MENRDAIRNFASFVLWVLRICGIHGDTFNPAHLINDILHIEVNVAEGDRLTRTENLAHRILRVFSTLRI